ncbi:hypothetical protein H7347_08975 [Corynebacterium sp. zg-331]|uniref:hypothetical protein n=1 Tax=unclassified Corynebacterium TaxID=2624378 RepID=UPI00128CE242|nr:MULTISPECIES: hypothetical protein [unclassified Corynebacterium]MBC3186693.1 hypothetical protein [Corynebacterium sp. zg-331]MPV53175.1 hypothetical protein [Corynebacterium sp. zg331]
MRDLTGAASRRAVEQALAEGETSLVVPASWVPAEVPEGVSMMVACGFPTGRHHPLIKASEARLGVQSGADAVLIILDAAAGEYAWTTDIVTAREAVSEQVRLVVGLPAGAARLPEMKRVARRAGAQGVLLIEGADPRGYGVRSSET